MKNPTRIDAGTHETLLHVEITLDPTTKQISLTGNIGEDPILFTYILSLALQSYMQREMSAQASATLPAHKRLVLPNGPNGSPS